MTNNIKQRDSIALGFWIGAGGRYEEDSQKGIAHFLEHIVFKGSQKYSCSQIKELIEGVGGTLNAFTSEEQTCFYAKIPSKHIDSTFDVLSDMTFYPRIKPTDIEKEKGVIVEEIKMYRDLPQYFVMELLDGLLWPDHPLGKFLAGDPKTVLNLTKSDINKFHKTYYNPSNIVVSACGSLGHKRIAALTKKKLGVMKNARKSEYLKVGETQDKPRSLFFRKDIEQMHLALGIPALDENHKDRNVLNMLSTILGGNMSSRLFVEVRENKGLAYSISSSFKALHDTGMFMVRAGIEVGRTEEAVGVILKELDKITRLGVNASEFRRAKDYLLGQLLLGLEDTMDNMLWLGESVIARDKIKTIKMLISEFDKIKIGDIKRVAKNILDKNKYNLAIVGPVTEKQEKSLNKLLSIK
ncbi:MAG: pitrilysin family protein [Candidatus Zapsychrus exili]|nr:pitrilysin family protein [Candidatus Zapsychrus exili]